MLIECLGYSELLNVIREIDVETGSSHAKQALEKITFYELNVMAEAVSSRIVNKSKVKPLIGLLTGISSIALGIFALLKIDNPEWKASGVIVLAGGSVLTVISGIFLCNACEQTATARKFAASELSEIGNFARGEGVHNPDELIKAEAHTLKEWYANYYSR